MKLAWLTDPHLNFAGLRSAEVLAREANERGAEVLVITGDIGESDDLIGWLHVFEQVFHGTVAFVLGNHDFYGSSVDEVRRWVEAECEASGGRLVYLSRSGPLELCEGTTLVGHDGWGDGRAGDIDTSGVMLADFVHIEDLRVSSLAERKRVLASLGDACAAELEPSLREAASRSSRVVVATHVPPFVQACWHDGKTSDDAWAPYFVCVAVGELLERVAREHPDVDFLVLCGHTHGAGEAWVAQNLHVKTGGATYRKPALQPTLWLALGGS